MSQNKLQQTVLDLLDKEPYKSSIDIDDNPLDKVSLQIKKVLNHTYFKPFNIVSSAYAKDILQLLWRYYYTKPLDNSVYTEKNKGRPDKEIKTDISTIEKFIKLLDKNCIYKDSIERNYQNKQDDRFVYDYCKNLIDDLETKSFKKSTQYGKINIKTTKEDVRRYFENLKNKYQDDIQQYEIENFINLL